MRKDSRPPRPRKTPALHIGSRLELLLDDRLIERLDGAEKRLNHPVPQEVVMLFDKPWEGNTSAYVTVFPDGELFRMYYRGCHWNWESKKIAHSVVCYAESNDGMHWRRPELGLFEFQESRRNNIIWTGPGNHNFTPFKDGNPDCAADARYKAVGSEEKGLLAYRSPDGIHWQLMQDDPIVTKGAFDSQNLAFWDGLKGRYVEYHRGWRDDTREIMTSSSQDFIHWSEPEYLDFGDLPREHLYTNAIAPYFRAPHIYLGFPKRFLPDRKKVAEHPFPGLSDGVFMSSRDGLHWDRWLEAFIRPGPQRERWWERNNMTAWGMLVTKPAIPGVPDELSLYSNESYYIDGCRLRRHTLRMDGFVSVYAPYSGGQLLTRPFVFEGRKLVLNYSTSAAGRIRVEVADYEGNPMPGFEMGSCEEIYGDEVEHVVAWGPARDLGRLAGKDVRLRFELRDADLYSFRFAD